MEDLAWICPCQLTVAVRRDRGAMMWTRAQPRGGGCWVMGATRPPRSAEVVVCGRPVASTAPAVLPTSTAVTPCLRGCVCTSGERAPHLPDRTCLTAVRQHHVGHLRVAHRLMFPTGNAETSALGEAV